MSAHCDCCGVVVTRATQCNERQFCVACAGLFKAAVPTSLVYVVRDGTGAEWARFLYAGMADGVATRCNSDVAFAGRLPFTVEVMPA